MSNVPRSSGEFTGRHMWMLILAFFGVIISVNVVLAVVASTSWTGLVVENSYVASQEYETKRLAHETQQAAGWHVQLAYEAGTAALLVVDGEGEPVELGETTLQLNRPVGGHDDQRLTLARGADGSYAASVTLDAGVWDALVTAPETPLGPFELHSRLKVEGAAP